MLKTDSSKPFHAYDHGTGPIDLRRFNKHATVRPIEIHLKQDGSLTNGPSFCFVMTDEQVHVPVKEVTRSIEAQISLQMLNDGLKDIGYEIKKIKL